MSASLTFRGYWRIWDRTALRQKVHLEKINHNQRYVHNVIEYKVDKQYNYDYNCSLIYEVLKGFMIHTNTELLQVRSHCQCQCT